MIYKQDGSGDGHPPGGGTGNGLNAGGYPNHRRHSPQWRKLQQALARVSREYKAQNPIGWGWPGSVWPCNRKGDLWLQRNKWTRIWAAFAGHGYYDQDMDMHDYYEPVLIPPTCSIDSVDMLTATIDFTITVDNMWTDTDYYWVDVYQLSYRTSSKQHGNPHTRQIYRLEDLVTGTTVYPITAPAKFPIYAGRPVRLWLRPMAAELYLPPVLAVYQVP